MSLHLAYIDPGSGSVIWQAAVGGVLGATYLVRRSVGGMITRVRSLGTGSQPDAVESSEQTKE